MILTAVLSALALVTQTPPPTQELPPQNLPDIVVEGRPRDERAAQRFVEAVTVSPPQAVSIAAWQTPFCLQILNLSPAATSILAAQIEGRAANLGVEVQPTGCKPNVTVVATSDGSMTAEALVDVFPKAFKPSNGPTQLDGRALQRFIETDAAVRWWNISAPFDTRAEQVMVPFAGAPAPWLKSLPGAFFAENEVQALLSAVVVIDARRTSGIPLPVLGDYIAMVALAEVDSTRDFSAFPSVLNLFSAPDAAAGLSEWDLRYLNALYSVEVRSRNSRYQRSEIARLMARPSQSDASSDMP